MLDATTLIEKSTVYRATDPAQVIYRGLLSAYSDEELIRVENAIGTFSLTGLLPESLRTLITAGSDVPAAA